MIGNDDGNDCSSRCPAVLGSCRQFNELKNTFRTVSVSDELVSSRLSYQMSLLKYRHQLEKVLYDSGCVGLACKSLRHESRYSIKGNKVTKKGTHDSSSSSFIQSKEQKPGHHRAYLKKHPLSFFLSVLHSLNLILKSAL